MRVLITLMGKAGTRCNEKGITPQRNFAEDNSGNATQILKMMLGENFEELPSLCVVIFVKLEL